MARAFSPLVATFVAYESFNAPEITPIFIGVSSTTKIVFCSDARAMVLLQLNRQSGCNSGKTLQCAIKIKISDEAAESADFRSAQDLRQRGPRLQNEVGGFTIITF